MALGARAGALMWLFVRRAALPVGLGIGVGLAGALAIGKLLQRFLIQTSPTDPTILVASRCCSPRCRWLRRSFLRGERHVWTRSRRCGNEVDS